MSDVTAIAIRARDSAQPIRMQVSFELGLLKISMKPLNILCAEPQYAIVYIEVAQKPQNNPYQ